MTCYLPNGTFAGLSGTLYLPCNRTSLVLGKHSACCRISDYCLSNGLCEPPDRTEVLNNYWRNGCTDATFQDEACPRYCLSGENLSRDAIVFKCTTHRSWCCGVPGQAHDKNDTQCCTISSQLFTADDPSIYATASFAPMMSSTIMGPTTFTVTPTVMTRPTESQPASSLGQSGPVSKQLKIGLGAGIPIGIALIVGTGVLCFCFGKKMSSRAPSDGHGYPGSGETPGDGMKGIGSGTADKQAVDMAELDTSR